MTGVAAHAADVVLERLDGGAAAPTAESVLHGAHDADFIAVPYAGITPAADRDTWYRVRLATDWHGAHAPLLSINDPQGLHVTAPTHR
jgi:hypothetical protein